MKAHADRIRRRSDAGFTLLEVMVAFMILTASVVPLLIALADSQHRVANGRVARVMKQLMEYKLAHVLLDRPPEGEEPIYVDGVEGNFGEEFAADAEKSYWWDENMYHYSFRIDSEEIDLGLSGGLTGEEENEEELRREEERRNREQEEDPLGLGAAGAEEDLGQLRYRVTVTIFYRPGNRNFDRNMSTVVFVKHPKLSETMTGPSAEGGGAGTLGAGEARAGAGAATVGSGGESGTTFQAVGSGGGDKGGERR